MTYLESAHGQFITYKRAIKEVKDHGVSVDEFIADCGKHMIYEAVDVLQWLGY
tara:strand:- start:416 stop:574 length:159 start_codon:yes stop_codon:yes gene_type:complete